MFCMLLHLHLELGLSNSRAPAYVIVPQPHFSFSSSFPLTTQDSAKTYSKWMTSGSTFSLTTVLGTS